jgi:phosphoribulokinase
LIELAWKIRMKGSAVEHPDPLQENKKPSLSRKMHPLPIHSPRPIMQPGIDSAASTAIPSDLRTLLRQAKRPILIAVAGDSGSGKTTHTHGIRRLLGADMVSYISLDGYHKEDRATRKASGRLPLDPRANDLKLVKTHLQSLRTGASIEIPIYNHKTGCFDAPQVIHPQPVVIIEGLHALYPNLLPYYDFTLFVDTDREVKWRWKFERDVYERGYDPDEVKREMQRREIAYRRWIDFQKTHADIIVKVHESELGALAAEEFDSKLPDNCYHMEILVSPTSPPLPGLQMPVDFNAITRPDALPFMLANIPSTYWGRKVNVVHVDGIIPLGAMRQLEREMMRFTGLPTDSGAALSSEPATTLRFTQLVVAWPFLGHVAALLRQEIAAGNTSLESS